ncbi:MAG: right-handed parallel beta-helix repeat-containing protein [Ruminococcus sp.]|nr:right-handed parallel beta-helix repeat-containing protein [Ruminococcus sp.]
MKNFKQKALSIILSAMLVSSVGAATISASAAGPGGSSQGQNSSSSASYSGATEISTSTTKSGASYSSTTGGQNALLVSGGTSTLTNPTVKKSGAESSESSDFYGTNAGVLVYNGAVLNINGGTVTTNGSHANGVFAYGTGTVNISDTTINTSANNSGGIMVTGGGTLTAENLTVTTQGGSSAAIRSDRGGGTMTVNGGTYTTNGQGSPSIYSTADVTVNNAKLISNASEGVVVEGKNSVTLNGVTLTDTNNKLNGQSTTYKNIFLYQSMSGDADEGTSSFTAKDSTITTNKGDTFYITNTDASISLTNNKFVNSSDGDFMRIEAAAWGTSGSNGGDVTLKLSNQDVEGDIIVDSISSLTMNMTDGSTYKGALNNANKGTVKLTLSADSTLTLTGDTYVKSLTDADSTYSNINFNGYKLYVNGTDISTGATASTETEETTQAADTQSSTNSTEPAEQSGNNQPPEQNGSQPSGNNGNQPPELPTDSNGNPQQPPADNSGQQTTQPVTNSGSETTATEAPSEQVTTAPAEQTEKSADTTETVKKTKKANTLKVSVKKKTVKKSKLKKSKKTVLAITVKNAQGKVTYAKLSGSKYLNVTKKGKIEVKKGTKKGTYKIKVKVTAKGNSSYKKASKTVTVKIKVK